MYTGTDISGSHTYIQGQNYQGVRYLYSFGDPVDKVKTLSALVL
jgi:hypothetical protein